MKLLLTVCVLSLVILVCDAGLFKRKSSFEVMVKLLKGFSAVNATIEIGLNNEKKCMIFSRGNTQLLEPGWDASGELTKTTVASNSDIQDLTFKWSPAEDKPDNTEYIMLHFLSLYDKKRNLQQYCPQNQKIARDSIQHLHKCF